MARTPRVAIIGGGIGGAAAALALHRRGIEVAVYEQSAELREIGAGLSLSPNALKAFRALGVEAAVIDIGHQPEYQLIRNWRSGRVISRTPRAAGLVDRFGATFLTIHRADLLDILSRDLPESDVHLDAICVGVETTDDTASARFADGSEIEADIIVGADGIRSVVRESLFGPDEPRFTGCICWRGLVPVESVSPEALSADLTQWWGPHGHVVHYFVRRGELVNFVAHFDSDGWTEESWTHECDRTELMETYGRWNESLLRLIESSDRYYKWALFDRDPLDRWSRGRVTLLGDAAHPMLPYLGQGACMAVEDGWILAAAVARAPDAPAEALGVYERLRMPRTRRAQLGARHRAKQNNIASPVGQWWRNLRLAYSTRVGTDKTPHQGAWLYDYDVAAETGYPARDAD